MCATGLVFTCRLGRCRSVAGLARLAAALIQRALALAALGAGLIWTAGLALLWVASDTPTQQQVPDVMLTELNGARTLSLPQLIAGKPTVVNLWATWCGPCRAEMPTLAAAQQNTPEVNFVFVNQESNRQRWQRMCSVPA